MNMDQIRDDLLFLVEHIERPFEQLLMLRPTLEVSLLKLGHAQHEVSAALDDYYSKTRTLH